MTERAEGFWWVRWRGGPWDVVRVRSDGATARRSLGGGVLEVADPRIEWGPYLGKGPDDDQRIAGASHHQPSRATLGGSVDPMTAAVFAGCRYARKRS